MQPTLSTLFKIRLTAFLDFLWILSGRVFGSQKAHKLEDFDSILINRADRLGDAIISRPLLALFARYVRRHCERTGVAMPDIRVIASAYNADFLRSLADDGVVVEVAAGVTSYEYDRSPWYALCRLASGYMSAFPRIFSRARNRIAFVDLVDSVTEWVESDFPGRKHAVWISSNRGPYSPFFDFSGKERFSGSTRHNLVESYIDLFGEAFSLPDFRAFVYGNMDEFYPNAKPSDASKPVLCLVGVKEFRNFSADLWHRIILAFARVNPDRMVEVIDAPDNLVRNELEGREYPSNVAIIDNPHPKSLSDFAEWSSDRYSCAFGVDGGGINALRPHMDVCVAYTLGNHHVWSAFSGPAKMQEQNLGGGWTLCSAEVAQGRRESYVFKKTAFLPSFQIPVGKGCFDDLNTEVFVQSV